MVAASVNGAGVLTTDCVVIAWVSETMLEDDTEVELTNVTVADVRLDPPRARETFAAERVL